jgi:hypothetical protein
LSLQAHNHQKRVESTQAPSRAAPVDDERLEVDPAAMPKRLRTAVLVLVPRVITENRELDETWKRKTQP